MAGKKRLPIAIIAVLLVFSCPLSPNAQAQVNDSLIEVYQRKMDRYLAKQSTVKHLYSIDHEGIKLYPSLGHKRQNQPEITIEWSEVDLMSNLFTYTDRDYQLHIYEEKSNGTLDPNVSHAVQIFRNAHGPTISPSEAKPLRGFKVAIDPGHLANDMQTAKAEGRFIEIRLPSGEMASFFEADLAFSTAMLLKDSLEQLGAEVMLTRDRDNLSASGKSFRAWIENDLKWLLKKKGMSQYQIKRITTRITNGSPYYRYFLRQDLNARAKKINDFSPDVAIIIHFNADNQNLGWNKPSYQNYGMMFIPGSFLKSELYSREDRYDLLRLLITSTPEKSEILAKAIMNAFEEKIGVPAVIHNDDEPGYLRVAAIYVDDGVYARNLRLCRIINAPLCYGEPLLQDNINELKAFTGNSYKDGIIRSRVKKVASAYFQGILRYAEWLKTKK